MTILDFAKYLLALNPEANASRLSLYHYLKNHCQPGTPLSSDIIHGFYSRALSFAHWRQNREQLAAEIKSTLESFLETHQADIGKVVHASDMQIIELEHIVDLYEVTKNFLNKKRHEADRVRVLPEREDGMVGLILKPDGSLFVYFFDRLTTIRSGRLEPLCTDLVLKYNTQLELATDHIHHVQIQPGITARFQNGIVGVSGKLIRGYAFQKMEDFADQPLNRYPVIFYPVKRLERFFINRSTDPLYLELSQLLDQSITLLRDQHPDAIKLGSAALERGQNALKLIFPDDKLLALLIRELSDLILRNSTQEVPWAQNKPSDSINS